MGKAGPILIICGGVAVLFSGVPAWVWGFEIPVIGFALAMLV